MQEISDLVVLGHWHDDNSVRVVDVVEAQKRESALGVNFVKGIWYIYDEGTGGRKEYPIGEGRPLEHSKEGVIGVYNARVTSQINSLAYAVYRRGDEAGSTTMNIDDI